MMITAIPTLSGKIAPECDSATEFTLVEGSGADISMRTVTVAEGTDPSAIGSALSAEGALRILASGMSRDLMASCEEHGMQVFYGAMGSIPDALNLISLGILDQMAMGQSGCGCGGGGCGCGGGAHGESESCASGSCACGSNAEAQGSGTCGSGCGCGN